MARKRSLTSREKTHDAMSHMVYMLAELEQILYGDQSDPDDQASTRGPPPQLGVRFSPKCRQF